MRGCECQESTLDGHWTVQASQSNGHYMTVTPHQECVLRITVLDDTASGERKVRHEHHMSMRAASLSRPAHQPSMSNIQAGPASRTGWAYGLVPKLSRSESAAAQNAASLEGDVKQDCNGLNPICGR